MIITNIHGLPPPVVRAAEHAAREHDIGDADYSVTGLIEPPRISHLKEKHANQLTSDSSAIGDSLIGTAVDTHLGQFIEDGETANVRLFVDIEVDGKTYTISGEYDWYSPTLKWLVDWKTPKVYEWNHPKIEREIQLNIYRYMLARHGYPVERMNNTFLFKDYSPATSEYRKDQPPAQMMNGEPDRIAVWTDEEVEEYIRWRIRLHRDANDDTLCSDQDRWIENKWAVMNENGTRAMNNAAFDSDTEAYEFCDTMEIPYDRVEFRAGEPRRCKHWCDVAAFCQQWKGETEW